MIVAVRPTYISCVVAGFVQQGLKSGVVITTTVGTFHRDFVEFASQHYIPFDFAFVREGG